MSLRTLRASGVTPAEFAILGTVTLLVLWLVFYPTLWLGWAAFHRGAPGDTGPWTLDNFALLFEASYWRLVGRSLWVGLGITAVASAIGVPLAWLTVKTDMPFKRLVELSAILPFFTSTFIGGLAWIFLGNPTNGLLKLWFGLPVNVYSMSGIIWVTGIYMAPYMFLFTSAALRNMDTTYEEASFMCGASLWRTLCRVTFPLILPALLSGMSLVLVISMGIFGVAAILGFPGKITLLATEIYARSVLTPPNYGAATVCGLTLMAITAALIVVQRWILRSGSYALVGGRGFRMKLYALGKWTPLALIACGLYALLAVILPGLVLIKTSFQSYPTPRFGQWTLDNWTAFFEKADLFQTLLRSLYLSTLGATFCVVLTAVIAYIIHRSSVPGRRLLEQVSVMPIGIPGIVMGLAMIWAYIVWPIWGTLWVLVLAYLTLFMPYGVRALGSTIVQIHPELEESSRVHGASWLRTFWRVVMPLLRPGIYSTWILLFIIFIREISAAVLLTSINTRLFPVLIFEQWTEGYLNVMSAGALLLSLIMLAVIALFKWGFRVDLSPAYR
ncbi:MAG: ABC transporter permease [Betaproteobacteria bacterium]